LTTTTRPKPKQTSIDSIEAEITKLEQREQATHELIDAKQNELVEAQNAGDFARAAAIRENIGHLSGAVIDGIHQEQGRAAQDLASAQLKDAEVAVLEARIAYWKQGQELQELYLKITFAARRSLQAHAEWERAAIDAQRLGSKMRAHAPACDEGLATNFGERFKSPMSTKAGPELANAEQENG
jgi:hypothetical protein